MSLHLAPGATQVYLWVKVNDGVYSKALSPCSLDTGCESMNIFATSLTLFAQKLHQSVEMFAKFWLDSGVNLGSAASVQ